MMPKEKIVRHVIHCFKDNSLGVKLIKTLPIQTIQFHNFFSDLQQDFLLNSNPENISSMYLYIQLDHVTRAPFKSNSLRTRASFYFL